MTIDQWYNSIMNEIIYLESSEEITSVIDKMRANPAHSISFVIPRGATIAQSIVNLKLLKKSAAEMDKEISLVANDRISRNLASQIGLTVYSKVSEAERSGPKKVEGKPPVLSDHEVDPKDGQFRVNNYYRNKKDDTEEDREDIKKELEQISEEKNDGVEAPEMEISTRSVGEERTKEAAHHKAQEDRHDSHIERIEPRKDKANYKPEMNKPTNIKRSRKPIIILLSIAGLAVIILAYLFLPYTTIAITVKTEDFSIDKEISVDRNATANDTAKLVLAGKLLEQEKEMTKSFDATGKKDIGSKAAGTLSFSNSAGVDDQVAAGTIVKSLNGSVEFTLDQAITISKATAVVSPGGQIQLTPGKATGKVTAKNSGEKGNLPAGSNFSVAGKSLMSASGETTGGVSKEIKVVTADDLQKAQDSLKTEIETSGKTDLLDSAKNEKLSIFDNSEKSEILSTDSSKKENDEADKFDYTVKIKLFAIGFVKGDLDNLLIDSLNSGLGQDKMLVNPSNADIKYDLTDNNIDSGVLTLKASFTGKTGPKISETELKKEVKGKMTNGAKQIVSAKDGVQSVEIKNWPSKMPEVPWLTKRIKVTFDYAK